MMNPFTIAKRLREIGLAGINQRNADYVLRWNPRKFYPRVDDKVLTKQLAIAAGLPLRGDHLRTAPVVRSGQSVQVVSRGQGFEVANEGTALNGAAPGEVVRVRLATGTVVSGNADGHGRVEVRR